MAGRNDQAQGVRKAARPTGRASWVQLIRRCNYDGRRLCEATGLHDSSLHRRLRKFGPSLRPKWQYEDWERILAPHKSVASAAKALKLKPFTLVAILRRLGIEHGFPVRHFRQSQLHSIDTETLYHMTREQNAPTVARLLGVPTSSLLKDLKRRGIPMQHHCQQRVLKDIPTKNLAHIYAHHGSKGFRLLGTTSSTYYNELNRRGIR